jgi:hypothetical protein
VRVWETELIDELGCDDFALHVLQAYCKESRIPVTEMFKAAFLALRHVRAINYIRTFVRQMVEGTEASGYGERVRLIQLREHRLRGAFSMMVGGRGLRNRGRVTRLQAAISELSDLQDKRIDEIELYELFPNLPAEFATWREKKAQKIRTELPSLEWLANQRGWHSGLTDAPFVSFPKASAEQEGPGERRDEIVGSNELTEYIDNLGRLRSILESSEGPGSVELTAPSPSVDLRTVAPTKSRAAKIGRNDPCHCGSGKKYKRCHLNREKSEQMM